MNKDGFNAILTDDLVWAEELEIRFPKYTKVELGTSYLVFNSDLFVVYDGPCGLEIRLKWNDVVEIGKELLCLL